ncbi:MAG: uracil phosphoribosyltransferase [Ignavibacterium sp.]|jgi:uracil phosphoribosyltransferase|nr:uracil phosphoribosyltransferase [Ignavibacterium sp.]
MKENLFIVEHPIIKRDVTILRDKNTESETFRAVLQRVSNLLAAEVSKKFSLTDIIIETPLETAKGSKLTNEVILVPVLRAGLGMVNGFLQIIPEAKVGHIGLQRDEETLQPIDYYYKIPKNLATAEVVMLDPMLATGGSASEAISYLKKHGAKNPVFVCIVAAPEGVKKLQSKHPDIKIFAAALDRELNSKGYILPGLGDAGDRTFGTL